MSVSICTLVICSHIAIKSSDYDIQPRKECLERECFQVRKADHVTRQLFECLSTCSMDHHALHQVDSVVTTTYDEDAVGAEQGVQDADSGTEAPVNVHRFQHNQSILALASTDAHIYAGTQGGEILVCSVSSIVAVLALTVSGLLSADLRTRSRASCT